MVEFGSIPASQAIRGDSAIAIRIDALVETFDLQHKRDPQRVLLASPRERCSAGELDALARKLETTLSQSWVTPDQIVAVRAVNGPGLAAALIALRRCRMACLMMDGGTPFAERMRNAQHIGAAALLEVPACWPGSRESFRLERVQPDGPYKISQTKGAVVKLTSGSTGTPRGIAISSEALIADDAQLTRSMGLHSDDRLLAAIPLTHSYGLSSLLIPSLARGVMLVLPDGDQPFAALEAAHALAATVYPTVPAQVGALAQMADRLELPPSLRRFISAGALLPSETAARFRESFKHSVHTFYGASECGGICYDREGRAAERGTVGTPIDGVRIRLGDQLRPDQPAPIQIESDAVALGYVPNPGPNLAAGTFSSEDLGIWQGAELRIVGRGDDLINVKGNNVNPREIETVLRSLKEVDDVFVLGIRSEEHKGNLVRAIVASKSGALRAEDVLAWCRRRLISYKIPRSVVIVREIPRTARGKIDRDALSRLGEERPRGFGRD